MDLDSDIFRLAFEANPRPMWVFDRETRRFLLVNDAVVQLYGWSRDELLAMTLIDVRPPSERAAFEASYAAAKPTKTYARVGRHCTKSGELIDVHLEVTRCMFRGREVGLSIATNVTGIADAERRFRLLVEHSGEAISLVNAQGIVEYLSPASERILGYPASEIVGKNPAFLIHPDDVPQWSPPAPGALAVHVARVRHRDGSLRWIESSTTNLTHDPAVRAYVSNFRDITERKAAESAASEARGRLEYLLSATSAITYTARAHEDFTVTFISANIAGVLGYPPERFLADRTFWKSHIHPDDLARVEREVAVLFERNEHSVDYRFRHADGSYRQMRDAARVTRDDTGKAIEVVGCFIDVTEQFQAQESLRRSEANFRALIERSPTATLVHRDGKVIYVNRAAAAMLGYPGAPAMVGMQILDLVHPDDRPMIQQRIGELLQAGATPPRESRMIRRDGSVLAIEAEAIRLEFDGQLANVVLARDVTERREMFTRMALADRMLTVGTLAAGVAHEINNPLAYIATNLAILEHELPCVLAGKPTRMPASELPSLIADAREGVARVSAIVRDLRTIARPDEPDNGPVDAAEVLATSIKLAHNELRHRARVIETYEPALPHVNAHGSRLGQVFLNLLLNAAQAIPEGRADHNEIRVRASASPARDRVIIEVEDTGSGIPAPIIRRIFDPFFTTKAPGVGMGLGLAISHQIVHSLGGEITVESTPGFGTTFRVVLPAAGDEARPPSCTPAPPTPTGARILLVDDEAAVGRSLTALLAGEHVVVPVTRAQDALARMRSGETFDVILCDLMMPEVSGIELYDLMSADERARIVFMTGGAFTPQAREFLAKVDRPRIEKPFSELELRAAIERVTGSRGTRPDLPAPPA